MTHTNISQSWFVAPPLRGAWPAALWILFSLPVATAIRSVMNCGEVIGECCTPLFLYVMVSAVLLGPLVALMTTGASAAVSLILFSVQASRMKMGPMVSSGASRCSSSIASSLSARSNSCGAPSSASPNSPAGANGRAEWCSALREARPGPTGRERLHLSGSARRMRSQR